MKNLIQSILILTGVLMSTTGAEEVIYAKVGDTVTLRKSASSEYGSWKFVNENGLELAYYNLFGKFIDKDLPDNWKSKLSVSEAGLIIQNIQQEHFGTFIQANRNSDSSIKTTTTYKVFSLSVSRSPDKPLLPGDSVTLACDTGGPQGNKPRISWLNPQGVKVAEHRVTSGGKLTVKATSQDHGQWTCVVTSDKKEQISVLVVDFSPAPSHAQYTSESSRLTIPFSILPDVSWEQIKNKGVQGVHWYFFPKPSSSLISEAGQRLFSLSLEDPQKLTCKRNQHRGLSPPYNLNEGGLSLTRRQARVEDRGDYMCSLEFKNGRTMNRTIHIDVLELTSSPTEIISGQQVNLTCSIGQALAADMQLKWFKPQNSSLRSLPPDGHLTRLTIPVVGSGDGGVWRCELRQKDTLLTSAVITLKIEPMLSVWMLVTICAATVIIILVCILLFIFYRRRQRMMRHPRNRLCQCKIPKPKGFYRT